MSGPLQGFRVLDCATVVAGPALARHLADLGAEVIKIEHPVDGDPARRMGFQHGGESLWWKTLSRNKLPVTLDLSHPQGAELLLHLAAVSDVLVESFRPGTLERWGLGPERLHEANPDLVIARVSGFGQTGPDALRPGFGTLAEAMSGWAGLHGVEGGPPQLPATALADETAGAWGAVAVLAALLHRERGAAAGAGGRGQVIDVSLYEPLLASLGPLPALFDLTGQEAPRMGNRLPFVAPRGAYECADGAWFVLSGSSPAMATRVLAAIGRPELATDPRFATNEARLANADELDTLIAAWAAQRTRDEALGTLTEHDAAAGPVYRMGDLLADPHVQARGSVERVDDDRDGVAMAAVTPRLSATPGELRWAGRPKGAANADVYGRLLDLDAAALERLADAGVI